MTDLKSVAHLTHSKTPDNMNKRTDPPSVNLATNKAQKFIYVRKS